MEFMKELNWSKINKMLVFARGTEHKDSSGSI